TIPKPLPKRSKRAWGKAKGGAAIGCRLRGSLRRHGVFGSRFFFRFAVVSFFARSLLRNERVFSENDPYRFVGRVADPPSLRRGLVSKLTARSIAERGADFVGGIEGT
ncbi:MAG TPA: hypothetical protein VMV69_16030, partial [Pirellulales bacterium]|nr:hypothetical protein [Pirellulales bacterium]